MISQQLGAVRQQAITWTNVDPNLCRHMASLGHNEFNSVWLTSVSPSSAVLSAGSPANPAAQLSGDVFGARWVPRLPACIRCAFYVAVPSSSDSGFWPLQVCCHLCLEEHKDVTIYIFSHVDCGRLISAKMLAIFKTKFSDVPCHQNGVYITSNWI